MGHERAGLLRLAAPCHGVVGRAPPRERGREPGGMAVVHCVVPAPDVDPRLLAHMADPPGLEHPHEVLPPALPTPVKAPPLYAYAYQPVLFRLPMRACPPLCRAFSLGRCAKAKGASQAWPRHEMS